MPTDSPEGFDITRHAPAGMPAAPAHRRDAAIASLCRTAERLLMAWGGSTAWGARMGLDDPTESLPQDFSPVVGLPATVHLPVIVEGEMSGDLWRVYLKTGNVALAVPTSQLHPEEP